MFTTSKLYIAENFWPSLSDLGTKTVYGRDPFNKNLRKFRSKAQWIGSVQPEKFRKKQKVDHFFPVGRVGILVECALYARVFLFGASV